VARQASTRADYGKPKLLEEKAKCPERNSSTQPRGGFPDKVSQLGADTPRRTATYDGTYQLPNHCNSFVFPLVPLPLRL
jgi:hypothetical protein